MSNKMASSLSHTQSPNLFNFWGHQANDAVRKVYFQFPRSQAELNSIRKSIP